MEVVAGTNDTVKVKIGDREYTTQRNLCDDSSKNEKNG